MANRTWMFALLGAVLLSPGCTQRLVLRMSTERPSTVTLVDKGDDNGADDDKIVVLKDRAQIETIAAFFEARVKKWQPMIGRPAAVRRNEIKFRRGNEVTDWFWLERDGLCLSTPSGRYYTCKLSEDERTELLAFFSEPVPEVEEESRL